MINGENNGTFDFSRTAALYTLKRPVVAIIKRAVTAVRFKDKMTIMIMYQINSPCQ